jgi:hypothetical protein
MRAVPLSRSTGSSTRQRLNKQQPRGPDASTFHVPNRVPRRDDKRPILPSIVYLMNEERLEDADLPGLGIGAGTRYGWRRALRHSASSAVRGKR